LVEVTLGSSRRLRRVFALLLSVSLLTIAAGAASAAPSRPNVNSVLVNSGSTLAVQTVVNRGSKQIASCSYVLDSGAPVSCGPITPPFSSKVTWYLSSAFPTPAPGEHTVVVTVRLTDGGSGTSSLSWTIAAPPARVFVRAFTDTNADHVFQAGTDHLIASVVDSNGDGVVSVGDTIFTDEFPLTPDPVTGFGTFGVKSATVDHVYSSGGVSVASTTTVYSFHDIGEIVQFEWFAVGSFGSPRSVLQENMDVNLGNCDCIQIAEGTGLSPDPSTVDLAIVDSRDNEFLDISFDLP
jgi:hypothetical protein